MANVFIDKFIKFEEFNIEPNEDIFESILNIRKKGFDRERFFLKYIPASVISEYDFNDPDSLKEFRDLCLTCKSPIKGMGGCNLREELLEKDIRYAGKKLSDPNGNILGAIDIRNNVMTYSPIFPFFYEERDLIKFANDTYFTTIPFEEILMNQINHATEFYVHTGDYQTAKELIQYGTYIFEEISKEQMIEYITNPELGEEIMRKYLKL